MKQTAQEIYAQLYDISVPDWQGEMDFYRGLTARANSKDFEVLEIACGTGRIALRLAQGGVNVTGLDLSPALLEVARGKSIGIPNIRWVLGDMRTFDLGRKFNLAIIPGHSFQFMLTPDDQVQCLKNIKRHLEENGMLVVHLDHQDILWLASLLMEKKSFTAGKESTHPVTGQKIRRSNLWTFEPSTQTATAYMKWEGFDANGNITDRWEHPPMPLHCVFRFEMEHLLNRAGLSIEAVYGDFFRNKLTDKSSEMLWVARNKADQL